MPLAVKVTLASLSCCMLAAAQSVPLQNTTYKLSLEPSSSVSMQAADQVIQLRPRFTVIVGDRDPHYSRLKDQETAFWVPSWRPDSSRSPSADFFSAGRVITVDAVAAEERNGAILWKFAPTPDFQLAATLTVPDGNQEPKLQAQLTANRPGWFSVGYAGMPEVDPSSATWLWQPLVWQEKRFPAKSFLSTEYMCPLPATFLQTGAATVGLAVDPGEVPFRLPTFENSRFGVMLRNSAGRAQPMAFAPVYGLPDSHLQPGAVIRFTTRPFVLAGDWFSAYRHLAQDVFSFHDYRHNGSASLNTTLDNMIDFAMNDTYSGWNAELKGFDYATDVPGTVKVVSALHPLSIAVLRDDPEIYRRRALPLMEYMMSRQKYLFSLSSDTKDQNPSHLMKGPAAEVSELGALYSFSRGRSPVFRYFADVESKTPRRLNLEMVSSGDTFQDMLALYRMTGEPSYLNKAKSKADAYIAGAHREGPKRLHGRSRPGWRPVLDGFRTEVGRSAGALREYER